MVRDRRRDRNAERTRRPRVRPVTPLILITSSFHEAATPQQWGARCVPISIAHGVFPYAPLHVPRRRIPCFLGALDLRQVLLMLFALSVPGHKRNWGDLRVRSSGRTVHPAVYRVWRANTASSGRRTARRPVRVDHRRGDVSGPRSSGRRTGLVERRRVTDRQVRLRREKRIEGSTWTPPAPPPAPRTVRGATGARPAPRQTRDQCVCGSAAQG